MNVKPIKYCRKNIREISRIWKSRLTFFADSRFHQLSIFHILFNALQCETIHIHHLLRSLNSVCKIALQAFSKTERNRKRLSLVEDRNRGRSGSSPVETLLHYPTQTTSFLLLRSSATKSRFLLCIMLLTKLNYFQ